MPHGPGQVFDQGDQDMEDVVTGVNQTPDGEQGYRASPKPAPPVYQGGQTFQGDQPEPVQAGGDQSPGGHNEE